MTLRTIYFTTYGEDSLPKEQYYVDSGFGEKVCNLIVLLNLSKIYDFSIVVDERVFFESMFLDFPDVTFLSSDDIFSRIETSGAVKTNLDNFANKITKLLNDYNGPAKFGRPPEEMLKAFVNEDNSIFNVDGEVHDSIVIDYQKDYQSYHKSIFRLQSWIKLHTSYPYFEYINKVSFKNSNVNQFLINNFSDIKCIHIRRGSGVQLSAEYLNSLSQYVDTDLIKKYYKMTFNGDANPNPLIPDEEIFEVIEKTLEEDPNKLIYLSFDVPKIFVNHIIEKYPNNIVTKEHYIDEYFSYFSEHDLESPLPRYSSIKNVLLYLFEFFVLCYSESKFPNESKSTWIHLSNYFGPKENM